LLRAAQELAPERLRIEIHEIAEMKSSSDALTSGSTPKAA
jgi:hypothetical protein